MDFKERYNELIKKQKDLEFNLLVEIRNKIKAKGWTHREVAKNLGVSIRSATYLFKFDTAEVKCLDIPRLLQILDVLEGEK